MLTIRFERGNMARTFPVRLYDKTTLEDGRVQVRYITEDEHENFVLIGEDSEQADWHDAYVMNDAGKTIDSIRA